MSVPLPDDFEYEFCPKCNKRRMTPDLERRLLAVEAAARSAATAPIARIRRCMAPEHD